MLDYYAFCYDHIDKILLIKYYKILLIVNYY